MSKKDFLLGGIIGVMLGILSLPITKGLTLPGGKTTQLAITIVLPIGTLIGLAVANFIGRKIPLFFQLAKFIIVGALNTFIDFAVLNSLILISGLSSGLAYSLFKADSFAVAVINSFFWNKYWTFGSRANEEGREFFQFVVVSVVGFGINVLTASFIVNVIGAPEGIRPNLWANFGALVATALSLTWNFLGYKFVVFRK